MAGDLKGRLSVVKRESSGKGSVSEGLGRKGFGLQGSHRREYTPRYRHHEKDIANMACQSSTSLQLAISPM